MWFNRVIWTRCSSCKFCFAPLVILDGWGLVFETVCRWELSLRRYGAAALRGCAEALVMGQGGFAPRVGQCRDHVLTYGFLSSEGGIILASTGFYGDLLQLVRVLRARMKVRDYIVSHFSSCVGTDRRYRIDLYHAVSKLRVFQWAASTFFSRFTSSPTTNQWTSTRRPKCWLVRCITSGSFPIIRRIFSLESIHKVCLPHF